MNGAVNEHCAGDAGNGTNGAFSDANVVVTASSGELVDLAKLTKFLGELRRSKCGPLVRHITLGNDTMIQTAQFVYLFRSES